MLFHLQGNFRWRRWRFRRLCLGSSRRWLIGRLFLRWLGDHSLFSLGFWGSFRSLSKCSTRRSSLLSWWPTDHGSVWQRRGLTSAVGQDVPKLSFQMSHLLGGYATECSNSRPLRDDLKDAPQRRTNGASTNVPVAPHVLTSRNAINKNISGFMFNPVGRGNKHSHHFSSFCNADLICQIKR